MAGLRTLSGWLVALLGMAACVTDAPTMQDGGAPDVASDGQPDSSSPMDGGVDTGPTGPCDRSKPWGMPVLLTGIEGPSGENSATLSADELEIFFDTVRAGGLGGTDLWRATRASRQDKFSNPAPININTMLADLQPALTPNGQRLFFGSNRVSNYQIYTSLRIDGGVFSSPPTLAIFGPSVEVQPFVLGPDVWFESDRDGTRDIFRGAAADGGWLTTSSELGLVNTNVFSEGSPVLSADGLQLWFASNRNGTSDVCLSERKSPSDNFPTAAVDTALSTMTAEDYPEWISPDGCRIYVVSNRAANAFHVYVAERPPF